MGHHAWRSWERGAMFGEQSRERHAVGSGGGAGTLSPLLGLKGVGESVWRLVGGGGCWEGPGNSLVVGCAHMGGKQGGRGVALISESCGKPWIPCVGAGAAARAWRDAIRTSWGSGVSSEGNKGVLWWGVGRAHELGLWRLGGRGDVKGQGGDKLSVGVGGQGAAVGVGG